MFFRNLIKEHRELKYLAYHDPLTGLLNRNWLHKNIKNISFRYVYFWDINNLREVNKKGHTVGDEYIKKIVKSIPVTGDDILIRYAGDEFILFSDRSEAIKTNDEYCVRWSGISGNIWDAINKADKNMMKIKQSA